MKASGCQESGTARPCFVSEHLIDLDQTAAQTDEVLRAANAMFGGKNNLRVVPLLD